MSDESAPGTPRAPAPPPPPGAPPPPPAPDPEGWIPIDGVGEPDEVLEIAEVDHLTELTHPVRSRIMRALKQPRTVAEAAATLDVPVTRLYHHVNRLESLGFIRVVATRKVAAVTERRYQVSAASFQVDHKLFESSDPTELAVALGSVFETSKMSFQREVEHGSLSAGPTADQAMITRSSLTLTKQRRLELIQRLQAVYEEFIADDEESDADTDDDTQRMELFIAVFPDTL